jgi:hypothetical protein
MESRRWWNPSQPQTLQIAMFLLYTNAAFALFDLLRYMGRLTTIGLLLVFARMAGVAAAYGIANEQKWAYGLGTGIAALPLVLRIAFYGNPLLGNPISLMFEIALIALLLHPQSREYQKIWFS